MKRKTIIEVTQTECECNATVVEQVNYFNIKAKVELIPAIGKRLKIMVNPPLNSTQNDELLFDGSKLPEDMVREWLKEKLTRQQVLNEFQVISSNKKEQKIEIIN